MSNSFDREFIAQVAIVLAVCGGAWLVLVQPKAIEAARLEQQLGSPSETDGLTSQEGIETLAETMTAFRTRLGEIQRRNALAEDTSSLYATIMRLAAEHQVRVQALQPAPLKQTGPDAPVKMARLEMTISGDYERVARFIDDISSMDAFIRPASLQLMPIDTDQARNVSARFGCDVLAFSIDDTLAGIGGATNGQP